jgi:prophage antirepressor-like protein
MNTSKTERESYQIVPFTYENHAVRTALIDGEPWFIAKDVCDVLGLGNPSKALLGFPDDERGITICDTIAGEQKLLAVNEAGLCRLIFRTRKPDARRFKTWVLAEVLPTLRQATNK